MTNPTTLAAAIKEIARLRELYIKTAKETVSLSGQLDDARTQIERLRERMKYNGISYHDIYEPPTTKETDK